jgi:hypothetical protein
MQNLSALIGLGYCQKFANNLERRAAKMGGTIDAQGLYLARREMGNFVSSILGTTDPKALRLGTSKLVDSSAAAD